jgi:hypothetical protein
METALSRTIPYMEHREWRACPCLRDQVCFQQYAEAAKAKQKSKYSVQRLYIVLKTRPLTLQNSFQGPSSTTSAGQFAAISGAATDSVTSSVTSAPQAMGAGSNHPVALAALQSLVDRVASNESALGGSDANGRVCVCVCVCVT